MARLPSPARDQARATAARYYIGKPCRHGHATGIRYTSTGACAACMNLGRVPPDALPLLDMESLIG